MLDAPSPSVAPQNINGRYELKDTPIGQGGMGIVYKAYDTVTRRFVALKTTRGNVDPAAIELFEREWTVLARISHPNIVDILDTGEFRDNGERKPYFVMPLLRGVTLDQLIKASSERLTVERVVEIIYQACRGLQAAHDQGLVHRDIKPSNIFVMDDDTVKIIDFGVAHLADTRSVTGIKGTLQYMSPEQLEMKPTTPLSDIFSLGVVCYEAFTGRKPFGRKTDAEIVDAIRTYVPAPASEINPAVNQLVSRTVHKAMAKQHWHRFPSAREFADTLQRALRNEPIERFDRGKIQPRIDRIKKAQSEGDYQFAAEILNELESEGNIDPEMSLLKAQIEQTVRQRTIRQLLESARTRIEEDELPLALQKIQNVLDIDPANADALALKSQVERQRSERQIENWFRLVRQHVENQDYLQARQGVGEILKINSADTRARELLSSIDRTEQELIKAQGDKQKLYDAALDSYRKGEISTALSKLERLLELDRTAPKSANPERDAQYQSFYNQVRSEREAARNAYAEARKFLHEHNFTRVFEICQDYLGKNPGDPLFQSLKIETEETQRQQQSQAVAEINRRVDVEADLDKKYNILNDAAEKYPQEPQFKTSLKLVKERRDLINSIVARAQQYEDRNQLNDAAGQWDILKNIYPQYPGLDFQLQRLSRRREEQTRAETKALWVEKIDRHLNVGEYEKANEVVRQALLEFSGDEELQGLGSAIEGSLKRSAEAGTLVREGQELLSKQRFEEGLEALRKAERLDEHNPAVRAALTAAVLKRARELMLQNWRAAEPLVAEAVELDGADPVVRSLATLIEDYKRQEAIGKFVVESRNLQAAGNVSDALKKVEEGLTLYPNDIRLSQLHNTLRGALIESRRKEPASSRMSDPVPVAPASPVAPKEPAPVVKDLPSKTTGESQPSPAASDDRSSPAPIITIKHEPPKDPVAPSSSTGKEPGQPNRSRMIWSTAAAAAAIIIAAILVPKGTKPLPPSSPEVSLSANVSNAGFRLNGQPVSNHTFTLKPGAYKAEASADGYTTESKSFTVTKDDHSPLTIAFDLQPLLPEMRIVSDLKAGKYVLDGGKAVDLQDGSLVKENIPSGDHTLAIFDGGREVFLFSFTVKPKEPVLLKAPLGLGAKMRPGVVITSLGASAKVYATPNLKGGSDGSSLTPIPESGIALALNERQAARFVVDDGTGKPRAVPIDFSPLPILSVVLSGAPEKIPVVINANVSDGVAVINGRPLKKPLTAGAQTLFLPPGTYKIKVIRDGYGDSPEQLVALKSGDAAQKPLQFTLAEITHPAMLAVDGAPANAEILTDDKPEGNVGANGVFTKELELGSHSITIRKPNYEDFKETYDFKAGATVKVHAAGMKAPGIVNFKVVPQHAEISYQREGESQSTEAPNANIHSLELRAGSYKITAKADGFESRTGTVTVVSGQTVDVDWNLKPKPVIIISHLVMPSDIFENGTVWTQQTPGKAGGWWIHAAKGISVLRRKEGLFSFNILSPKDSKDLVKTKIKKVTFVVDYSGPEDKVVYTLDSHGLSRKVYSGGKGVNEAKLDLGAADRITTITVEISLEKILVKNKSGKIIDSLDRLGNKGRFGFEDEVVLSYAGSS